MELTTTGEVIDALGGVSDVAKLAGRQNDAIAIWKKTNRFPAHTYLLLREALKAKGYRAPASLWAMTEAKQAAE